VPGLWATWKGLFQCFRSIEKRSHNDSIAERAKEYGIMDLCLIDGLVHRTDLNGRICRVSAKLEKGRHQVTLQDQKQFNIMPSNLGRLEYRHPIVPFQVFHLPHQVTETTQRVNFVFGKWFGNDNTHFLKEGSICFTNWEVWATPIFYIYQGQWQWTPDCANFMPCTTTTVKGGQWNGAKPVQKNQNTIHQLQETTPILFQSPTGITACFSSQAELAKIRNLFYVVKNDGKELIIHTDKDSRFFDGEYL